MRIRSFAEIQMNRAGIVVALLVAIVAVRPAQGQISPAALVVELQNVVEYQEDTTDLSKWGTNPNVTQGLEAQGMVACAGVSIITYGDIVSVNGKPARGSYVGRGVGVCMSPNPTPGLGDAISDISANSLRDETYYILQPDGVTPIGTIMINGLNGSVSPPPPGLPAGPQDYTIVGGTGAFLGVRSAAAVPRAPHLSPKIRRGAGRMVAGILGRYFTSSRRRRRKL